MEKRKEQEGENLNRDPTIRNVEYLNEADKIDSKWENTRHMGVNLNKEESHGDRQAAYIKMEAERRQKAHAAGQS